MEIAQGSGAEPIGKLQRVSLREVWKHEALDFTSWLQQNIDVLNDQVGLSLSAAERERAAGDFSVDLVAEDEAGNPVVIENQLEKSNHDHLGKLLTYLVAIGAKTAIWIVSEPRSEHVSTISWLNESSSGSFYLLKVEAIRIGDSFPAPLLTLVVGPTQESREVGWAKKEWAERETLRHRFWSELLERSRQKTTLHTTISPGKGNWIGMGAGRSGLAFNYVAREHSPKPRYVWAPEGEEIDWDDLRARGLLPPVGFKVLPRRWVVERSFSWVGHNRRMSKDYERLPETGEAFIYVAITRLMSRRLART